MSGLLQEVRANPDDRPLIILAGYRDRMEAMLSSANHGLYRRIAANEQAPNHQRITQRQPAHRPPQHA